MVMVSSKQQNIAEQQKFVKCKTLVFSIVIHECHTNHPYELLWASDRVAWYNESFKQSTIYLSDIHV